MSFFFIDLHVNSLSSVFTATIPRTLRCATDKSLRCCCRHISISSIPAGANLVGTRGGGFCPGPACGAVRRGSVRSHSHGSGKIHLQAVGSRRDGRQAEPSPAAGALRGLFDGGQAQAGLASPRIRAERGGALLCLRLGLPLLSR
jgi:hypothetical protein